METMETKMYWLKKMITESSYLVCLMGKSVSAECGCTSYYNDSQAYAVEAAYGYSPEEMFSANFLTNRAETFYDYYRNCMISNLGEPGEGLLVLRRLEELGLLKAIITREVFSLARRAHCENVVEVHGSIYENFCPRCKREYPMEYVRDTVGVPKCMHCGIAIRPRVALMGEMVDNQKITRASQEVARADTLLILGCTMREPLVETFISYFEGSHVILINDEEDVGNFRADLIIKGKSMDILANLGI